LIVRWWEERVMAMKRAVMVVLAVVVACILWSPAARAQCPSTEPFGHYLQSYIDLCTDAAPVDAIAGAFGSGATIAFDRGTPIGIPNLICESSTEIAQAGGCQLAAGSVGDGKVTVDGNWGTVGALGCPNPAGLPGVGRNVYAIRCNDESGLIITVGYDVNLGLYGVDYANKVK